MSQHLNFDKHRFSIVISYLTTYRAVKNNSLYLKITRRLRQFRKVRNKMLIKDTKSEKFSNRGKKDWLKFVKYNRNF